MSAAEPGAGVLLVVNGEPRRLAAGTSVAALIVELALKPGRFAVEIDGAVVPASEHATRELRDGEALEIVTFVGGG